MAEAMVTGGDGVTRPKKEVVRLLVAVILANFGDAFCVIMMSVALPDISDAYHISLATANWVQIGFAITGATIVMMSAAVQARIGLKKLFFYSRVLLVASCLLGLFSLNFPMMLVARLLQGFACGALFPIANTVVIQLIPPAKSGGILAINSASYGVSLAIAPVLAGLCLSFVSLTSMFAIPLVFGIVTTVMGRTWVFDVEPRENRNIDGPSIALSFAGLAALMYGFSQMTAKPKVALPLLAVGAALLVWFTVRQLHLKTPLLDLEPLRRHAFVTWDVLFYMTGALGEQAILLVLPLYLERACDLPAFAAGLLLMVVAGFYAAMDAASGKITDRYGMWPALSLGFLIMTVGLVAVILLAPGRNIAVMTVVCGLAILGFGLINVPGKDVVLEHVPSDLVPHTNSVYSTSTQIAGSMGSALFVGIVSADVLRGVADGTPRQDAYVTGFQNALWIAVAIEAAMFVASLWYSRQMVKHGINKIQGKEH